MKTESIRGEFKVYTVMPEKMASHGNLYQFLKDAGFGARQFSTAEAVLTNLVQEPPHIIISHLDLPQMKGIDFLENIQEMSDDILMLMVTSDESEKDKAFQKGAYDVIDPNIKKEHFIKLLDKTVEKLYLKFQNEQLLEELDHQIQLNLKPHVTEIKTDNKNQSQLPLETKLTNAGTLSKDDVKKKIDIINQFVTRLSVINNTNDIIDCFINNLSSLIDQPVVYLKYIPSHTSLLVTQTYGLNIDQFKNAGIPFKGEPQDCLRKIQDPENFQQLQQFMKSVFKVESYLPIPVQVNQEILGLVVVFDNLVDNTDYADVVSSHIKIFKLFLEKVYFQEKTQGLIISDLHTGAYNKKYFMKILDQEMSRAYRIKHPLSLLYLDVDDFDNYVKRNGEQIAHILLRMIAHAFIKTSRKTDWVSKWQKGEFVMLLPHTDKERAMIKAERLRRMMHSAKLPYGNHQPLGYLSISIGISEYPSLSWDATSLIQVADNALYQVKTSTKNKSCLGVVSKEFKPDFEVISVVQK